MANRAPLSSGTCGLLSTARLDAVRRSATVQILRITFLPATQAANVVYGWLPVILTAVAALAALFGFRDPSAVNHSPGFWAASALGVLAFLFARTAYIECKAYHRPFPKS